MMNLIATDLVILIRNDTCWLYMILRTHKAVDFHCVTGFQNVQLPSALYIFLLILQGNGHGMKIVLVIDTCDHFKIVMN